MSEKTELIKWVYRHGYAEGFSLIGKNDPIYLNGDLDLAIVRYRHNQAQNYDFFMEGGLDITDWFMWPLFLVRAIEVVNRADDFPFTITQFSEFLQVTYYNEVKEFKSNVWHGKEPVDQAKYKALLLVKELSS